MTQAPRIVRVAAAGDAALRIDFEQRIDPRINAAAIGLARRLRAASGIGVRETVVGYASVTVYMDPLLSDVGTLAEKIRSAAGESDTPADEDGRLVDIPVRYGGEAGPDLDVVAAYGGCSADDVIARHSAVEYRVYMVGFAPGFAYLGVVPESIAAPRRQTPRPAVPAGSVAIAGPQTGIYPSATPGGWNLIGRTSVRPYDPGRPEPFLLRAGDHVRFTPVLPR